MKVQHAPLPAIIISVTFICLKHYLNIHSRLKSDLKFILEHSNMFYEKPDQLFIELGDDTALPL